MKLLHTLSIKEYKSNGKDVEFSIYGLFDTESIKWTYHAVSHIGGNLTMDICKYSIVINIDTIKSYGKRFNTKEEGIKYLEEYKDKWEYGSNDTRCEKRDKKIDDILDES